MKFHVSKWLVMSVACAILLAASAIWGWWERAPVWQYPVVVAILVWLYLAGALILWRIGDWRAYVCTLMYMEAIEDGECNDWQFTWKGCDRWYKEHGSPWKLQPIPEAMRVHDAIGTQGDS